jgi:hypothetical protein
MRWALVPLSQSQRPKELGTATFNGRVSKPPYSSGRLADGDALRLIARERLRDQCVISTALRTINIQIAL